MAPKKATTEKDTKKKATKKDEEDNADTEDVDEEEDEDEDASGAEEDSDEEDDEEAVDTETKKKKTEEKKKRVNADTTISGLKFDVNLTKKAILAFQLKRGIEVDKFKKKIDKDTKKVISKKVVGKKAKYSLAYKAHALMTAISQTVLQKSIDLTDKSLPAADLKLIKKGLIKKAILQDKHWRSFFKTLIDDFKDTADYGSITGLDEKSIGEFIGRVFPSITLIPSEGSETDKAAIKAKTLNFINYLLNYVFATVMDRACMIADYNGKTRISPREVAYAVKMSFTGAVYDEIIEAMRKVCKKFDLKDPFDKQGSRGATKKKSKKSKKTKDSDSKKTDKKKKKKDDDDNGDE